MNIDLIKQLRDQTGVSVAQCKQALEKADGDTQKALEILREQSKAIVNKKSQAETRDGLVEAYVHTNAKIGALLELGCQTDFVARNADFKALAKDLAMQIAASEAENVEGLLSQQFIKDPSKTVQELINENIAKLGENIKVNRFTRFSI